MRKLAICALLGASWIATPCLAQDYSFKCTPTLIDNTAKDPIVEIDVEHHGQAWSVIHFARSGAAYDRSTQYRMNNVIGAPSVRWRGLKLTSPNLLMVGIVDNAAGQPKYMELLIDQNRDGAIIMQSEANCFPRADTSAAEAGQKSESSPAAPSAPAVATPAPQQDNPISAHDDVSHCGTISEPTQRLSCYDKVFPPPSSAANTSVQPTANVTAQQNHAETSAPVSSDFSAQDIEKMHSAYSQSAALFEQNYIGKTLVAELAFDSAQDPLNTRKFDVFFSHDIACRNVSDPNQITTIANLKNGDLVAIRGTITDHTFGKIYLKDCGFSKP